jgi:hypothetical protein
MLKPGKLKKIKAGRLEAKAIGYTFARILLGQCGASEAGAILSCAHVCMACLASPKPDLAMAEALDFWRAIHGAGENIIREDFGRIRHGGEVARPANPKPARARTPRRRARQ